MFSWDKLRVNNEENYEQYPYNLEEKVKNYSLCHLKTIRSIL